MPGPSAALFASPYYSCQQNVYVSTTGNDSNSGTANSPWQTLQKASNTNTGPGSCVNVAPGTYDGVQLANGGSSASATGYVVFRCTTMDACKVKGNAGPNQNAAFTAGYCQNNIPGNTCPANSYLPVDYVMVDGFELAGPGNQGGQYGWGFGSGAVPGGDPSLHGPHHMWLLNSVVHDFSQTGIGLADADYLYALHNEVYDNSQSTCDGSQGSGISINSLFDIPSYTPTPDDKGAAGAKVGFPTWAVGSKWFHTVLAYNVVFNNAGTQCTQNTDANGIIFDSISPGDNWHGGYTEPMLAHGNVVYDNGSGGIHLFGAVNTYVSNNTVFNNFIDPNRTMNLGGGDIDDYGRSDTTDQNYLYNNIVAACTSAFPANLTWNGAMNLGVDGSSTNDPAVGNMTYQVSGLARCSTGPGSGSGNNPPEIVTWGAQTYSSASNFEATNPQWANVSFATPGTDATPPASANFALSANSPAIGKGTVQSWMPAQAADLGACHHSLTTCP